MKCRGAPINNTLKPRGIFGASQSSEETGLNIVLILNLSFFPFSWCKYFIYHIFSSFIQVYKVLGWPMWCAHYLWWYIPAFIRWRSGTIIRLTAVLRWIRKITQPFIVNIVAETSTTLHGVTIHMDFSANLIYSLGLPIAKKCLW